MTEPTGDRMRSRRRRRSRRAALFGTRMWDVVDELPLHVRSWTCPVCRTVRDRDHNAATVILVAGRRG
jgi:hypothetical protein